MLQVLVDMGVCLRGKARTTTFWMAAATAAAAAGRWLLDMARVSHSAEYAVIDRVCC
jgi:hypothetical protein